MKATLTPYPAYKPTTIPWLQQVPEHWEVLPGLSHLRFKQVKNTGMVEKRVLSLSYGRIIIKPQEKLTGLVPESFETYQIVEPGDIIIRATDLQNDRTSLRVGEVKDRGIITSAYLCLNVHSGMVPAFGYYLIHAYDLMKWLYGYGSGLRQNLDWVDFKRMPLVVPPPAEQHLIVRYLHALDAKVKRYIRAKRSLIARLQEQKQAIIQQAVTRGLDPNVKLKPSGVEWLGEVPEHWEVVRLRTAFLGVDSGVWGIDVEHEDDEDNVFCMRAADFDMQTYGLNPAKRILRKVNAFDRKRKSLLKGDLLLEKSGGGDAVPVGRVVYADGAAPMVFSNFLTRLRPDQSRFVPKYLLYLLNTLHSSRVILADIKQTTGLQNLDERAYLSRTVLIPRLNEQRLIVEQLDRDFEKVNQTITTVQRDIQLMLEYHTRLIADVVTGAVDVTAAAKAMPADQMISGSDDQMMEEEPLSMAAEGEEGYGVEEA